MDNNILETKLKIVINNSFYKKELIDESTYLAVNDKLVRSLRGL